MPSKKKSTQNSKKANSKFARHAQDDAALAPESGSTELSQRKGMTFIGKILVFLVFPTLVGFLGLYMGYLAKRDDPNRDLNFDTDFALPFLLALTMCIVVGFQTRGFASSKPQPLVFWPKVKKRKKIVHKHVVVGQNPDEVEGVTEDTNKDTAAKKND